MEKVCAKCNVSKPFSSFSMAHKSAKGDKNGLRSTCKACRSALNQAYNQKRAVITKENNSRWYSDNSDWAKHRAKVWRDFNPERHAENNRIWNSANKARKAANSGRYKARKNKATPSWLDAIQLAQIQEFYDIASCKSMQTGVEHHVDHIVPLKGDHVRGLHVPWNLQILTALENVSKKNKMIEAIYAPAR